MVPTVSLTRARMSTSMSCCNISPREHQWVFRRRYSFIFPHGGSKKRKKVKVTETITRSCLLGLPRRIKNFVKVRESRREKEQLGAEEWDPCLMGKKASVQGNMKQTTRTPTLV